MLDRAVAAAVFWDGVDAADAGDDRENVLSGHQEAVARIRFCISESLLGVIACEVGLGKTVEVRAATSLIDPTAHHSIYVAHTGHSWMMNA